MNGRSEQTGDNHISIWKPASSPRVQSDSLLSHQSPTQGYHPRALETSGVAMDHADGMVWLEPYSGSLDYYNPEDLEPSPTNSERFYPLGGESYDFVFGASGGASTSYTTPSDFSYGSPQYAQTHHQAIGLVPNDAYDAKRPRDRISGHNQAFETALNGQDDRVDQVDRSEVEMDYARARRRPGKSRRTSYDSTSPVSPTTPGSDQSPRADRNRERNRLAASKCREKSKKQIDDLKQKERELGVQRASLTAHAADLKEEVLQLKNEILKHGECDCDFIRNYLAKAARDIT